MPIDSLFVGKAWHERFSFHRPLHVLVHDMVLRFARPLRRIGAVLADRHNLDRLIESGRSALIYPGPHTRPFVRSGNARPSRLGIAPDLSNMRCTKRILLTPVVSAGVMKPLWCCRVDRGWQSDSVSASCFAPMYSRWSLDCRSVWPVRFPAPPSRQDHGADHAACRLGTVGGAASGSRLERQRRRRTRCSLDLLFTSFATACSARSIGCTPSDAFPSWAERDVFSEAGLAVS